MFFYKPSQQILIDSGATSTLVSLSFALRVGIAIQATQHGAKQLDKSPLHVTGEVKFSVTFGEKHLMVDGSVNSDLDCDTLAGTPFCKANKVDALLSRELISIDGTLIAESVILRNDRERVLYPGDYLEVSSADLTDYDDQEVAIEPRVDSPMQGSWPSPTITRVIQGAIRIPNHTDQPVRVAKCQHFTQIRRVVSSEALSSFSTAASVVRPPIALAVSLSHHFAAVHTDHDLIPHVDVRRKVFDLKLRYD